MNSPAGLRSCPGRGRTTEMYHQLTTFRDGTMVRIEYFTTWAEALEAAGLSD
jgi:hypothetical protein